MAFVFRAERKIDLSGKEKIPLGPGAYVGHKEYKPKPTTGRDATGKTQMATTHFNPGPGQYKPEVGFDQISKSMQSAKNLSVYGLEKFGITVIKPSNCFASKVDRFQNKDLKEKAVLPGPGQYVNDQNWAKGKRSQPKPEWQQITWNRQPNPPSIPSHDFVFGYEEVKKGELVKQQNTEKVHTGVKQDTVGPGEYEVVKPIGASKKGPTWHQPKNNKKIPLVDPNRSELPGPGQYNADKVDIFPIYKYKPSSVFVSKVPRDKQMRATSQLMPPKPQSQGNQSYNPLNAQGDDDYYDEDEDDGTTPGPGAYFNPHASTTFKIKSIPERLQFFGSTVERFHENTSKNKLPPNVGPGSYTVQTSVSSKKMRSSAAAPFLSTDNRFIQKQEALAIPGPGQYQAKTIVEELQKKPWGKQGVFGSTEKRFVQAQTLQTPGPGMYKPERAVSLLDKKNESNIKRSSSMFISNTKRNPYEFPKHIPPVVQYDDKTNTISDVVQKKIEAGVGNPLLANLKAKRGINPGFSSVAQRFPEKKVDEADTFLGPGYYEQQSTFETKATTVNNNKSINFLSNAPRFNEKNKVEIPGPGHYSNEDLNNWYKRSYNMIFTE